MKYIWLQDMQKKEKDAIECLKEVCLAQDGRLPLLNLPEEPAECDGCLAAVAEDGGFTGILTCLYGENTVEVCVLVRPDHRGKGIGTELLHRLILSTKKIPVFPVASDDEAAASFLNYIGKREICREMLMTLTREGYTDVKPLVTPGRKKRLRVTCETGLAPESDVNVATDGQAKYTPANAVSDGQAKYTPANAVSDEQAKYTKVNTASDRQTRYTLYYGLLPVGRCLVTEGCISEVLVHGMFRGRGFGSFLLRTVIRHQFHQGRQKLFLHVTSLNTAACALYRKYGFWVAQEVVNYL